MSKKKFKLTVLPAATLAAQRDAYWELNADDEAAAVVGSIFEQGSAYTTNGLVARTFKAAGYAVYDILPSWRISLPEETT